MRTTLTLLVLIATSAPILAADNAIPLAVNATGTGAIAPPITHLGTETATTGRQLHEGGYAALHVTCFVDASCTADDVYTDGVVAACCSGAGTGTCGTAPDTVDLEARPDATHAWQAVAGYSSTLNGRAGVFWFGPGEYARIKITDAAGTHTCSASLVFGTVRE